MKTRKIAAVLMTFIMAVSLTACDTADPAGNDETKALETTNDGIVNTIVKDENAVLKTKKEAPETPEEFHEAMVIRSFVQFGNTHRLNKKAMQMANGEKTTIAYIGGSITEGMNAGADGCYAKLSYEMISERYGTGDNVEYVNAGLSGTPSVLGTLRVGRDVLDYNADIVFIEFAVNDATDDFHKEAYESLVRTILADDNEPAVILLFTVLETGYTAQDHMKEIGEYYELPMISVADALKPEFDEGRMVWADYSDDGSHPHVEGHKLVAEFIENYFIQLDYRSMVESDYTLKPAAKFGRAYENSVMIDNNYNNTDPDFNISDIGRFYNNAGGTRLFKSGWGNSQSYDGGGTGGFKFKVKANAVSLIYKRNNNESMGKADIYLDGEKLTTINANDKDGWGDPFTARLIKWQGVKEMEIEIRMAEGFEDKAFEILGIAYSQNETFM